MLESVCVYDLAGTSVDLARVLAKTVPKVFYFKPWNQGGFPLPNVHLVGTGIPNIIRIDDFEQFKRKEKCELIVFTDIYNASLQEELQAQGYRVIGGRGAERFEIYRDESRKLLEKLGLPVNPEYVELLGMTLLRDHLKIHKEQYVKINKHRGLSETFHAIDYDLIELYLDELQHRLGSAKETKFFMVEGAFPSGMVEAGMDIDTADGRVADIAMAGIEDKDSAYACVVKPYNEFPDCLRLVVDKLLPVFGEFGYRGPYSYEAKIGKDLKPYVIDQTVRFGQPPGTLQWYMYKNLPDRLKAISEGIPMPPTGHKKYGIEIAMKSPQASKDTLAIRIPKAVRDNVFLYNYRMLEGKDDIYYVINQPEEIEELGSVVGEGDTLEECKSIIKDVCDQIQGMGIEFSLDAMDKLDGEIAKLDEFGINFFTDKPTEPQEEPKIEPEVVVEVPKPDKPIPPKVKRFLDSITK